MSLSSILMCNFVIIIGYGGLRTFGRLIFRSLLFSRFGYFWILRGFGYDALVEFGNVICWYWYWAGMCTILIFIMWELFIFWYGCYFYPVHTNIRIWISQVNSKYDDWVIFSSYSYPPASPNLPIFSSLFQPNYLLILIFNYLRLSFNSNKSIWST